MLDWLLKIASDFWGVLSEMAPYLLFGFFMAGALSVFISPRHVQRHLGGRGLWAAVKAAAFGVPLPLCSCGVIPVSASLRRHGAGKGATTAFLISTPQTGVDSIMVTYGLLGGVFAIFRPLAAFISGVLGGWTVSLTEKDDQPQAPESGNSGPTDLPEASGGRIRRMFKYGFITLPQEIGRALLAGLAIAALITAVAGRYNFSFADIVPKGILQILAMMLVGIPIYVCATASVPLAYAMILAGVSPGAAFAFLMTGPATNAATIATIWKVMGRRTAAVYLATMLIAATAGGLLLDQLVTGEHVARVHETHWMIPKYVRWPCAAVLLGVLGLAVIRRGKPAEAVAQAGLMRLTIEGMTCDHCADSVRKALLACPGVEAVQVDLAAGGATVSGRAKDVKALRKAVEELGYAVTGVKPPQG